MRQTRRYSASSREIGTDGGKRQDTSILDSGKLLAQSFVQEKRAMSLVELRAAAEAGNIPTADELVTRARALAPGLRERAVKAERDRNIARESVAEYLASGLIHTLCCGASGWCINFGAVTEAG